VTYEKLNPNFSITITQWLAKTISQQKSDSTAYKMKELTPSTARGIVGNSFWTQVRFSLLSSNQLFAIRLCIASMKGSPLRVSPSPSRASAAYYGAIAAYLSSAAAARSASNYPALRRHFSQCLPLHHEKCSKPFICHTTIPLSLIFAAYHDSGSINPPLGYS
jgi:hypothetical protein